MMGFLLLQMLARHRWKKKHPGIHLLFIFLLSSQNTSMPQKNMAHLMNSAPTWSYCEFISKVMVNFLYFPMYLHSMSMKYRLIYLRICISTFVSEVAPLSQKFYGSLPPLNYKNQLTTFNVATLIPPISWRCSP